MAELTESDIAVAQENYGGFFARSQDLLAVLTPDGIITNVNPAVTLILGYTETELIGTACIDLVHTDDVLMVADAFAALRHGAESVEVECRCTANDNTHPVVSWAISQDPATRLCYAVGRQSTEQDTRRRTADLSSQMAAIVDTIVDGVITIDAVGAIRSFNPAAGRIFGYTEEEVVGNNITMLTPEPHRTNHHEYLERYLTTGERKIIGMGREVDGLRKDGSHFPLELSVSEMSVGGERMFTGITRDITDRKRTEALLAGQTKAIDASQAVVEFNMDGTVRGANQRFLTIMEYGAEEIVGNHHRIFLAPTYANSDEYRQFWNVLNNGECQTGEYERFTKTKKSVWMQATYAPIVGLDGRPEKIMQFATDITERKEAESRFQMLNAELSNNLSLLRARDEDNSLLSEINGFLQASLSEAEILNLMRLYITRLVGGARAALYNFFPGANEGERQAIAHGADELSVAIERSDCWALRRGMPHVQQHGTSAAPVCTHLAENVDDAVSSVCVPIFADGGSVGLFTAYWLGDPSGNDQQAAEIARTQSVLMALSGRIGSAIEAIRLRARLEDESIRDGLTGLYNRRYLDDVLRREVQRARRGQTQTSIVLLDIDHFKKLNDSYGHDVGDHALRLLAQTISDTVRQEDIVCRYGGEEFAVLLTGATKDIAVKTAEAIRLAVARMEIGGPGGLTLRVTISAGVAQAEQKTADSGTLLREVDRALYQAKNGGRNMVWVSGDDEGQFVAA